jgi:hypothetical protein
MPRFLDFEITDDVPFRPLQPDRAEADWFPRIWPSRADYDNIAHYVEPGQPYSFCGFVTIYALREPDPDERQGQPREIRRCSACSKMLNTRHRLRSRVLETPW